MQLELFGQKLRRFRKRMGMNQAELARQLSVSPNLISIWERAYSHRGRSWVPNRQSVVHLVTIFAAQITLEEALEWVAHLEYRLGETELQDIFPRTGMARGDAIWVTNPPRQNFERLDAVAEQALFGVELDTEKIYRAVRSEEAPWLVSIDGIGGIGKTSLATALAYQLALDERFYDVVWVSANQQEFFPGVGDRQKEGKVEHTSLTLDTFTSLVLDQVGVANLPATVQEKASLLHKILKTRAYLIVVDNLETEAEYGALVPRLYKLANPTKFILTSRHSLYTNERVFHHTIAELDRTYAFELILHEANIRGITELIHASQSQLDAIYDIVGGNPLALKLVVGQASVFSLPQILKGLVQTEHKSISDLYTYIYWQAWHALDAVQKQILLIMPLAQGGDLSQIIAISELDMGEVGRAIEQLVKLSLVTVYGHIENRRYAIHRLTETFLLHEVIKW